MVGTFRHLITFAIFASWLFYIVTIAGMIALRLRRPELPRPYRMWGYPVTAIVFLLVAVSFIVSIAAAEPLAALLAIVIIGAGVPIYFAWRSWSRKPAGRVKL